MWRTPGKEREKENERRKRTCLPGLTLDLREVTDPDSVTRPSVEVPADLKTGVVGVGSAHTHTHTHVINRGVE